MVPLSTGSEIEVWVIIAIPHMALGCYKLSTCVAIPIRFNFFFSFCNVCIFFDTIKTREIVGFYIVRMNKNNFMVAYTTDENIRYKVKSVFGW